MQIKHLRSVSRLMLAFVLCAFAPFACTPPTPDDNGNTNTNTNDNVAPPDGMPIEVTVEGQGRVNQAADGDDVLLTAVPETDWIFEEWTGDISSSDNPVVVQRTDVRNVTAVFVADDSVGRPVTDSDDDGVADDVDDCPSTLAGDTVDASGCSASQRDSDQDGVSDASDLCSDTPSGAAVDADGCPDEDADADGDGVNDAEDECPDTAEGEDVDENGCAEAQRDDDGDKVPNGSDRCPDTPANTTVGVDGCPTGDTTPPPPPPGGDEDPVCGNAVIERGEQCDPPAEGSCNENCRRISDGSVANDECEGALVAGDGFTSFNNSNATDSTPALAGACSAVEMTLDLWFRHTASCDGFLAISACNATFDTTMAVWETDGCPTDAPAACSDDDCDFNLGSFISRPASAGQQFLIRVGGFNDANGDGTIIITCGDDPDGGQRVCGTTQQDCFASHDLPGCENESCCRDVCAFDPFCCESNWDAFCIEDAEVICQNVFAVCENNRQACDQVSEAPGCDDSTGCCSSICDNDPFCCLQGWDQICVDAAAASCR